MRDVLAFLEARGAGGLEHPGGTLLAHLQRVHEALRLWRAPADVCAAGLAHAIYGTDGLDDALASLAERPVVAGLIGSHAERLVYVYASLDRRASYRTIDSRLVNRFTGRSWEPDRAMTTALVDITLANELDVLAHSERMRQEHGLALARLFMAWAPLASPAARIAAERGMDNGWLTDLAPK